MRYQRPVIIGASVVAFGAAVAFMLPPTKPIGGARITSTEHQGFSPIQAAAPAENKPVYPAEAAAQPMASAPQSSGANSVEDIGNADADRDEPRAPERGIDISAAPAAPPPMLRPRAPVIRPMPRPDPRYAYADDDQDAFGQAYKQGYRWARHSGVQDWRECRGLTGAQVDGCRAYLRDAEQQRDDDEDDDRRPW